MSPSLLTTEELEALREGLQDAHSSNAEDINLVGSERKFRKRIPALETRLDLYSIAIRTALGRELQATCSATSTPQELIGPEDAVGQLREMACIVALSSDTAGSIGMLGMDPTLCFFMVEHAFGASIRPARIRRSSKR